MMGENKKRPHQIIVRVTPEANEYLRGVAKRHRLPLGQVAREMMERGRVIWVAEKKGVKSA